jgi:TonB family protein
VGLLLAGGCVALNTASAQGQEEITRKLKNRVSPAYPDLARRMNITGVVKIQVTIANNGIVKNAKLIGGHPVLANAAMEALKKWRYEPGSEETTGVVEFHFDPAQ